MPPPYEPISNTIRLPSHKPAEERVEAMIKMMFFFYPILEVLSLVGLTNQIGFGSLLLYLAVTFFVGINLIKSAGWSTLKRGAPPELLEAPFRLMAGLLILLPGLLSDVVALLILIPFVRRLVWMGVFSRLFKGRVHFQTWSHGTEFKAEPNHKTFSAGSSSSEVIDVPFERAEVDEDVKLAARDINTTEQKKD